MTSSYALAASEEEVLFEKTAFAERYRAYAGRTGMFFPWLAWKKRG